MREGVSDFLAEKLVSHLAETRKEQGLSINKLAWMSGVSPKAIAFIEQGVHSPTLKTFFRLAVALELDVSGTIEKVKKSIPKSLERKEGIETDQRPRDTP